VVIWHDNQVRLEWQMNFTMVIPRRLPPEGPGSLLRVSFGSTATGTAAAIITQGRKWSDSVEKVASGR